MTSYYRDRYPDLNVRHFHEKLSDQHQIELSYSWVKQALQGAGLHASVADCGRGSLSLNRMARTLQTPND
jgi:hypothetical protein